MGVALTKDSIDLGIVVSDAEASLGFYRDVLGFESAGQMDIPGGATMHRLMCGTSMVKLVHHTKPPPAVAPPGGIPAATGYRYFTISVSNIDEVTDACCGGRTQGGRAGARPATRRHDLDRRRPRWQLGRVPEGRLNGHRLVRQPPAQPGRGRPRSPGDHVWRSVGHPRAVRATGRRPRGRAARLGRSRRRHGHHRAAQLGRLVRRLRRRVAARRDPSADLVAPSPTRDRRDRRAGRSQGAHRRAGRIGRRSGDVAHRAPRTTRAGRRSTAARRHLQRMEGTHLGRVHRPAQADRLGRPGRAGRRSAAAVRARHRGLHRHARPAVPQRSAGLVAAVAAGRWPRRGAAALRRRRDAGARFSSTRPPWSTSCPR